MQLRLGRSPWLLAALLALTACGGEPEPSGAAPRGPVLWTLPVIAAGGEAHQVGERAIHTATGRGWETESVEVDLRATHSFLKLRLAEHERVDWATYVAALADREFLVRVADVDLMVLEGGPQWKPTGLWPIGPREEAEERARELARRLSATN